MSIKDAKKINGFKFRSWKQADGTWTDPFDEFDFWSRTFLASGTLVMEATDEDGMLKEIKKGTKKFKAESLSDESKAKFKDKRILSKIKK